MTDTELQRLMFSKESSVSQNKRMPDYDYIHKELLRNGVSKKLLWTEYMEDCRANGDEPLMYSQFCYHIQQDPLPNLLQPAHLAYVLAIERLLCSVNRSQYYILRRLGNEQGF